MVYSKQRETILDVLTDCREHPTADELYALIKAESPSISLATVYRNLNLLTDAGMIMRVEIPDGADRFDSVNDGHFHMICEKCGRVEDIPRETLPDVCRLVSDKVHFDVRSYKILFYGVCNACSKGGNDNQADNLKGEY